MAVNMGQYPNLPSLEYPFTTGGSLIEKGNLTFMQDGTLVTASSIVGSGTVAEDLAALIPAFAGVAVERKPITDATGLADVAIAWYGQMQCPSTVWNVGDLVTLTDAGAGVAGDISDQSVTKTTDETAAIGFVTSGTSGNAATTVSVALFSKIALMPVSKSDIQTFREFVNFSSLTSDTTLKFKPGCSGTLLDVGVRVGETAASTASKLATLTAGITGVACTGGVISMTTASLNTVGELLSGTAITAKNTFDSTDTIEFAISAVTAFVEGVGYIEYTIQKD